TEFARRDMLRLSAIAAAAVAAGAIVFDPRAAEAGPVAAPTLARLFDVKLDGELLKLVEKAAFEAVEFTVGEEDVPPYVQHFPLFGANQIRLALTLAAPSTTLDAWFRGPL